MFQCIFLILNRRWHGTANGVGARRMMAYHAMIPPPLAFGVPRGRVLSSVLNRRPSGDDLNELPHPTTRLALKRIVLKVSVCASEDGGEDVGGFDHPLELGM